jgi:DNA ligase-1
MTDFDGELLIPNIPFEIGSGKIRNHQPTPQAFFCVFDAPSVKLPFKDRYAVYRSLLKGYKLNKIIAVHHWKISAHVFLLNLLRMAYAQGYEGLVVKDPNSLYSHGYGNNWMKLKEKDTLDLPVIGTYQGKGKYAGMLGGVVVKYKNRRVNVGGGFSDLQRKYFWDKPSKVLGRTIEVSYQEETGKGSLRNPNFIRIRHDK